MRRSADAHGKTGEAWDVVAREKYRAELDEHIALLRAGAHNLLDSELDLLAPLLERAWRPGEVIVSAG